MSAAGRAKREAFDAYLTPKEAVLPLLSRLQIAPEALAFEPCKGKGDIANLLPCDNIYYCELEEGVDYLSGKELPTVDLIITNPPFSFAQEFINRSFSHCNGVIAYLLRVNFLGSQKRRLWWQSHLPTHLYVLSDRPSFKWSGQTDATEYAWFVWERSNSAFVSVKDSPGIYVV